MPAIKGALVFLPLDAGTNNYKNLSAINKYLNQNKIHFSMNIILKKWLIHQNDYVGVLYLFFQDSFKKPQKKMEFVYISLYIAQRP